MGFTVNFAVHTVDFPTSFVAVINYSGADDSKVYYLAALDGETEFTFGVQTSTVTAENEVTIVGEFYPGADLPLENFDGRNFSVKFMQQTSSTPLWLDSGELRTTVVMPLVFTDGVSSKMLTPGTTKTFHLTGGLAPYTVTRQGTTASVSISGSTVTCSAPQVGQHGPTKFTVRDSEGTQLVGAVYVTAVNTTLTGTDLADRQDQLAENQAQIDYAIGELRALNESMDASLAGIRDISIAGLVTSITEIGLAIGTIVSTLAVLGNKMDGLSTQIDQIGKSTIPFDR